VCVCVYVGRYRRAEHTTVVLIILNEDEK